LKCYISPAASVAEKQGTGEPSPSVRRHQSNGVPSIKRSMSAAQSSRELAKQKKFEALILAPSKNGLGNFFVLSCIFYHYQFLFVFI